MPIGLFKKVDQKLTIYILGLLKYIAVKTQDA